MSDKQPTLFKAPTSPQWATEAPGRTPMFKIHKTLGHAKSAVSNRLSAWGTYWTTDWDHYTLQRTIIDVYEWVDGGWVHHPELSVTPDTHEFVEYKSPYTKDERWQLRRKAEA